MAEPSGPGSAPDRAAAGARCRAQYAARRNPFVYFHSITDRASCEANDVDLNRLTTDLATTRNLTYITPNLCNDAHDSSCLGGRPGGPATADQCSTSPGRWI